MLVAVTKKISAERVREAYGLGIENFAENYTQEAILKQATLSDLEIDWHFIGKIQSNKIKVLARRFSFIHSVDSEKIIAELDLRTANSGKQNIFLEVNLAGEEAKSGCSHEELPHLIESAQKTSNLNLRGLMFMPPLNLKELEQKAYYANARKLRDKIQHLVSAPHTLVELSMGTSHDFEAAICEGATMVRIGTALFGQR